MARVRLKEVSPSTRDMMEEEMEMQGLREEESDLLGSDDECDDDASHSFAAYLNRTDTAPKSAAEFDLLARTDFHQETNDYSQSWFNPHADRDMAIRILSGHPPGTFFVRPSSQTGCYATSFVSEDGSVKHQIIYCLFPGYSMEQHLPGVMDSNGAPVVYDSVSEVVDRCEDLRFPLEMQDSVKDMCIEHQMKQGIGLVQNLVQCLKANDRTLTSISWTLASAANSIRSVLPVQGLGLRGPGGGGAGEREQTTHVRYCLEHHTASGLLPLSGATAKLLFQVLEGNRTVRGIQARGFQDAISRVITPNLRDADLRCLARALCKNSTLTSVDLCYNSISDLGARYLAEGLKRNATLRNLNLSSNYLSAEGVRFLARALCINRTIDSVSIKNQLVPSCTLYPVLQNSEDFKYCCAAIEHSLARKREFGAYAGFCSDVVRRSNWQCPFFGFRRTSDVFEMLENCPEGTYLFYLASGHPGIIFLAFVHKGSVMQKRVFVAPGGYSMRAGMAQGLSMSLFEMCAWKVSAMAREGAESCAAAEQFLSEQMPSVVLESVLRIFYLTPLWGLTPEVLENRQGGVLREGLYTSLKDLVQRNKGALCLPFGAR